MSAAPAPAAPGVTVFVSNINYQTTSEELAHAFAQFGSVAQARIITEFFRGQRRSRGIGFVDFKTQAEAQAAVAKASMDLAGRTIRMAPARPPVQHPHVTIFVRGMPEGVKEDEIKAKFAQWKPTEIRIIRRNSGEAQGFAFVTFANEADQVAARNANPKITLGGAESTVQVARSRPRPVRRFSHPRAPRAEGAPASK